MAPTARTGRWLVTGRPPAELTFDSTPTDGNSIPQTSVETYAVESSGSEDWELEDTEDPTSPRQSTEPQSQLGALDAAMTLVSRIPSRIGIDTIIRPPPHIKLPFLPEDAPRNVMVAAGVTAPDNSPLPEPEIGFHLEGPAMAPIRRDPSTGVAFVEFDSLLITIPGWYRMTFTVVQLGSRSRNVDVIRSDVIEVVADGSVEHGVDSGRSGAGEQAEFDQAPSMESD